MTTDQYLDALKAAAHAGDLKAKVFLDRYAAQLVELPDLSPLPVTEQGGVEDAA